MGGGNDTVNFGRQANDVTVINAETVNGSIGNDFITIGNTSGATTVTGGLGADTITPDPAAAISTSLRPRNRRSATATPS